MLLSQLSFYGVCLALGLLGITHIWATADINPYKDIQKILSEDFNPHVAKPEMSVIPWKMNYSFDNKKILEFKDKSEFPLNEVCACSLEGVRCNHDYFRGRRAGVEHSVRRRALVN